MIDTIRVRGRSICLRAGPINVRKQFSYCFPRIRLSAELYYCNKCHLNVMISTCLCKKMKEAMIWRTIHTWKGLISRRLISVTDMEYFTLCPHLKRNIANITINHPVTCADVAERKNITNQFLCMNTLEQFNYNQQRNIDSVYSALIRSECQL